MNVCLIPARGGSKRLPGKNIRPFFGRPVITYAIETARATRLFDLIFVSTDSREVSDAAHAAGVHVHHRSDRNSDDAANDYAVIREFLRSYRPDDLCYLYPVTPLLDADDIRRGYDMLRTGLWDVVWATGPGGKEAGAFYWLDCQADVSEDRYYEDYGPYELGEFHYHDVNTEDDWAVMAAKYATKYTQGVIG